MAKVRPKTLRNIRDVDRLHSVLQGFIGRKCWQVRFRYGDELVLHCGRRLSYHAPQLKHLQRGEWQFGTRGTAWTLVAPEGEVTSADGDEATLLPRINILEGQKITDIAVSSPRNILTITFGKQYFFRVIPTAADDKYDLPYWELFMPDHLLVSFGPGRQWTLERSDVPMRAKRRSSA